MNTDASGQRKPVDAVRTRPTSITSSPTTTILLGTCAAFALTTTTPSQVEKATPPARCARPRDADLPSRILVDERCRWLLVVITVMRQCAVCSGPLQQRQYVTCSDSCRAQRHGRFADRTHYRVYIPNCSWCGEPFTTRQPAQRFCSKRCVKRCDRSIRKARVHNAIGSYTWTEVMHLFLLADRRCAYCDNHIDGQPDPDHVVPLSRGGSNSITNIVPSCRACNCDKNDHSLDEWAASRAARGLQARRCTLPTIERRFAHLVVGSVAPRAA